MKKIFLCFGVIAIFGCSTMPKPTPQRVKLDETIIFLDSSENISRQYYALKGIKNGEREIYGFKAIDGIHVKYSGKLDKDGEPLPDFETLGHEVWHLIKPDWHKNNP